jgi:ribosomal protein S19E (S16A)
MIVTPVQLAVLRSMHPSSTEGPTFRPRRSLERLQKKGLVEGNPRQGWQLTRKGWDYLRRTETR